MDEKRMNDLQNKVIDFKRFSFILLAICGFLSVGLILPTDALAANDHVVVIGLIFVLLIGAFLLHRTAMATERQLYNEES